MFFTSGQHSNLFVSFITMLRDIYLSYGGIGTFVAAILLCVTMLSWLLSLTGIMVRDMKAWSKYVLILAVSVFPPLAVAVLYVFLRLDRRTTSDHSVLQLKKLDPLGPEMATPLDVNLVPARALA